MSNQESKFLLNSRQDVVDYIANWKRQKNPLRIDPHLKVDRAFRNVSIRDCDYVLTTDTNKTIQWPPEWDEKHQIHVLHIESIDLDGQRVELLFYIDFSQRHNSCIQLEGLKAMTVCQNCNKPYEVWTASVEHSYHYTESGLEGINLAGITVYSCPGCDVQSADIPNIDGLHRLIAKDIILTPKPMSGPELRFLRKETRLKPKEFADLIGVDPKTVTNWEKSETLGRQADVPVRVLVAGQLWQKSELIAVLAQLSGLLRDTWEDSWEDSQQEIQQLAAENIVLGFANQQWGMA